MRTLLHRSSFIHHHIDQVRFRRAKRLQRTFLSSIKRGFAINSLSRHIFSCSSVDAAVKIDFFSEPFSWGNRKGNVSLCFVRLSRVSRVCLVLSFIRLLVGFKKSRANFLTNKKNLSWLAHPCAISKLDLTNPGVHSSRMCYTFGSFSFFSNSTNASGSQKSMNKVLGVDQCKVHLWHRQKHFWELIPQPVVID